MPTILGWVVVIALLATGPAVQRVPLLDVRLVTTQLRGPVAIVGDPGDANRFFVVERFGRVMLVEGDTVQPEPLLDLSEVVESSGVEQGLLGIVLHPDFPRNGRIFLFLTDRLQRMVVVEYQLARAALRIDRSTQREILAVPDPDPFHNGGQLSFGPDGYLYVAIGDGGELKNGWRDGRDLNSLLGKILRIDVDTPPGPGRGYAIPADNPFVDVPRARPEVWVRGLRNPWRFSFDTVTDTVWIADVGQHTWEEVNRLPRTRAFGANFGWSGMEGTDCYQATSCDRSGITAPVVTYPHAAGNCAVVGGFVYRGPGERLDGQYLVGDYCSGRIWTIGEDRTYMVEQVNTELRITSFGSSSDGSAYLVAEGGQLLRIVPRPGGART